MAYVPKIWSKSMPMGVMLDICRMAFNRVDLKAHYDNSMAFDAKTILSDLSDDDSLSPPPENNSNYPSSILLFAPLDLQKKSLPMPYMCTPNI